MTEQTLVMLTQIEMPGQRALVGGPTPNPAADAACGVQAKHSAQLRRVLRRVGSLKWQPVPLDTVIPSQGQGEGVLTRGIQSQRKAGWSQSHEEAMCQGEDASGRSDSGQMIPDIIAIRNTIGLAVERKSDPTLSSLTGSRHKSRSSY